MTKYYATLIVLLFASWSTQAQCPAGDVTLTTQADVNNFVATYPNCTEIVGTLTIGGFLLDSDIDDLSGLSNLTTVEDNLDILDCDILPNLNGLNALSSVGRDLRIRDNFILTDISSLSSLTSVEGTLDFSIGY